MSYEVDPLPELTWIEGAFVRADLASVLSRFRGEMAAVGNQFEATGEKAGIQSPLGMEPFPHMNPRLREKSEKGFSVHGFARVSVPRCNPNWTFVEAPFSVSSQNFFLHEWCQNAPILHIWSGLFTYSLSLSEAETPSEMHGFCYEAEGHKMRWMEWKRDDEGTRLITRRKPVSFENVAHYKSKRTRDRMNRSVLFEILENLEIDPVSVFDRRELEDPHLFTSEPRGTSCNDYIEDRDRYRRFVDRPYPKG